MGNTILEVDDHAEFKYRREPYTPNALLGDWLHCAVSLRERAMLWFINEVTENQQWQALLADEGITVAWRTQLGVGAPPSATGLPEHLSAVGFTDEMFTLCMAELQAKAEVCARQGHDIVRVFDSDAAVYKRSLPLLAAPVQAAFAPLEEEARAEGEYRPDHGYAMLHIAHANMYPIEYGRTRAVARPELTRANCIRAIGLGDTLPLSKGPAAKEERDSEPASLGLDTRPWYLYVPPEDSYESDEMSGDSSESDEVSGDSSESDEVSGDSYESDEMYRERQLGMVRSRRFAWLPTDVEIVDGRPHLVGYLNNIHPEHTEVYSVVEELLHAALPMFVAATEQVRLTRLDPRAPRRLPLERPRRIPLVEVGDLLNSPDRRSSELSDSASESSESSDRSSEVSELSDLLKVISPDRCQKQCQPELKKEPEVFAAVHETLQPEPEPLKNPPDFRMAPQGGRWFDYGSGRLQVIVQVNCHVLTPENPKYAGGQWHLEGQVNEHIVASAIYYYDMENITESRLSFGAQEARRSKRYGSRGEIYGERHASLSTGEMPLGSVRAEPGRLVVFPNVLEHRVDGFELVDKTRPGHRMALAIFLVDPALAILSTSRVPPQQLHWADRSSFVGSVQQRLPPEVAAEVFKHVLCPYDVKTARKIRDKVMRERRPMVASSDILPQPRPLPMRFN